MGKICAQAAATVLGAQSVTVLERTVAHAEQLQKELDVTCITSLINPPSERNVINYATIVLAVKPQDATTALTQIQSLTKTALIISIMAGVTLPRLAELTGSSRIVRCMPNTPATIGCGMTVWTTTKNVTVDDQKFVTQWLAQFGADLWVESDDWIDKATAVSGSGPAYVFAFATDLIKSAQALGFTTEQATRLVQQTLAGAIQLWQKTGTAPETLRDKVTSKGGTTAAALKILKTTRMSSLWEQAVAAAYARAKDLQNHV